MNAEFFARAPERSSIELKRDKVYKTLNYLESPQAAHVKMEGRGDVLILSSNNYLGLCAEPSVVEAGTERAREVRRGNRERALHLRHLHRPPRARGRARALRGTESSLSYVSAWNANEGFTGDGRAGGRLRHLRRAQPRIDHRLDPAREGDHEVHDGRVQAPDMDDLREKLAGAKSAQRRIIWTDGIFSMEGDIAKLPEILELARTYDAIVVMDDSHATGVLGKTRTRDGGALSVCWARWT